MRQVVSVAGLKHTSQWPTVALTSRMASARPKRLLLGRADVEKCEPLRRPLADSGQAGGSVIEAIDRCGVTDRQG